MAVWAVSGMGFQCIVAPSYGEIFYNNCFENGLLPIRLAPAEVERLGTQLLANPSGSEVTIDLEAQLIIAAWGDSFSFEIDPLRKRTLLEGLDAVALTLSREAVISAWQRADRERRPWIYRP
jgi:3-isopropylmalate/(R)-2-methylmalate dehydratase small subunit